MAWDPDAARVYGVKTPLQPHQQRVLDKLRASKGVLVAHGVGSGKTLTSLGAIDQEGLPADVVAPAPLVQNYHKEIEKHAPGGLGRPLRVRSYEAAARARDVDPQSLVVLDEAHRGRNAGTAINQEVLRRAAGAKARLLLTGTPVFNDPYDAAVLLNAAAGRDVLPSNEAAFRARHVGHAAQPVGFWAALRGAKPVPVPVLKNRSALIDAAKGYVDVHRSGGPDFPSRTDEALDVPMSGRQWDMYRFHEKALPSLLAFKIRYGLPMNKAESSQLNSFQAGLRQTSNTPRPYVEGMDDAAEARHTPKINRAVAELLRRRQADPNFRGVVYSNYLEGGLEPYARALAAHGVPHNLFTGAVSPRDRRRLVDEYNSGKTPVMLLSGAGSEGLDLRGTKLIQELEPHWNLARTGQVEGRGIRFRSHAHLPEAERNVHVQKFYSTAPEGLLHKLRLRKRPGTIEHYIRDRAADKDLLARQIMEALERASEAGPLKTAAYTYGSAMKTANVGTLPTVRPSMMVAPTMAPRASVAPAASAMARQSAGWGGAVRGAIQDQMATVRPGMQNAAHQAQAMAANQALMSHLNPTLPRPARVPAGLMDMYNNYANILGKEAKLAALRAFGLVR